MTESEFWLHLEYRLCREFAGLAAPELRFLWCDGFAIDSLNTSEPGSITGNVWIGNGPRRQDIWTFRLIIPKLPLDQIDWGSLLPADDTTGWLAIDVARHSLTIYPQDAYAESRLTLSQKIQM